MARTIETYTGSARELRRSRSDGAGWNILVGSLIAATVEMSADIA